MFYMSKEGLLAECRVAENVASEVLGYYLSQGLDVTDEVLAEVLKETGDDEYTNPAKLREDYPYKPSFDVEVKGVGTLRAELYNTDAGKEISVVLLTEGQGNMFDIALVREAEQYDMNEYGAKPGDITVMAWSDPYTEDYTDKHVVPTEDIRKIELDLIKEEVMDEIVNIGEWSRDYREEMANDFIDKFEITPSTDWRHDCDLESFIAEHEAPDMEL